MKNILFIAYEFPPLVRGGVFRPLAFVKYLPTFGYNPIVITLAKSSYHNACGKNYQTDFALGAETLSNTTIIEFESDIIPSHQKSKLEFFLATFFTIHGYEGKGWQKSFEQKFQHIIDRYKPEAILATIPPFGILPLVQKYAELSNIPLILDFRDAWSQWRTTPYPTYFHYLLTLNYEKKYLESAAKVIVTSKQTKSDFLTLHKSVQEEKIVYIPNGIEGNFDEWTKFDKEKKVFTIGYVGSFYYDHDSRKQMLDPWWKKKANRMLQYMPDKQDWLYRTPYFFFDAIKNFFETYPEYRQRVKIRFAGGIAPWMKDMISDFSLTETVELLGPISHNDSIVFQKNSDLLLITSSKRINGADYSIAGKTFEYFKMGKPILAFVCEGAQKEILNESGMALICDPDHPRDNAMNIKALLDGQKVLTPDYSFLGDFTREKLTAQLAEVLNSVIAIRRK